jgi:large subunit ribosomal protein L22
MQAIAKARFVRTSPRKARLVIDAIRGKEVHEALAILKFTPNRAARLIEKVVMSAAANAENNFHMNGDFLKVAVAMVDGGPLMKRLRYAPMGRGYRMVKRTSHITIIVEEMEGAAAKRARKKPVAKVAAPKASSKAAPAAKAEPKAKTSKATAEKPAAKAKAAPAAKEKAAPTAKAKAAPEASAPAEEKKPRTRAKAPKPVVVEPEAAAEAQAEPEVVTQTQGESTGGE